MVVTVKNVNMISILSKTKTKLSATLLLLSFIFVPISALAQAGDSLTLSVAPTLYDMTANPGQVWRSNLKIINVNNTDLNISIDVVNFSPTGEGGEGMFTPITESDQDGSTVAEWIEIQKEIVVPRQQSLEIPLTVNVPQDAAPGGHFAAILVGTKPTTDSEGPTRMQTAQIVTSLFFARVTGEVIENGVIRDFVVSDSLLDKPEATFELRFENKGNVHLQPQGDIKITNMWGQERGIIPINQRSNFGNVLPESIRKFVFTWRGDWSVSDIGRYTATVTLGYGNDSKKFVSSKTTFWVIPFKLLFGILLGLLIFGAIISWLIKLYVRHMLTMAGIDLESYRQKAQMQNRYERHTRLKLHYPVQAGILDLKSRLQVSKNYLGHFKVVGQFIVQYKLFFIAVVLIVAFILVLVWYIKNANTDHRGFEVVYQNTDKNVTLNSEEIVYNDISKNQNFSIDTALPKVAIINRSGIPALAAKLKRDLQKIGYEVTKIDADFTSPQSRTVVVYQNTPDEQVLRLSSDLGNVLVSKVTEEEKVTDPITIYVGSDMAKE